MPPYQTGPPLTKKKGGQKKRAKIGGPCARSHSTLVSVFPVVVPPMKRTHTQLMLTQLQRETDAQIMKLKNY